MASTAHFDQAAAHWDEDPARRARSAAIAAAIRRNVPLHAGMAMLEYGCGTATLSFLLSPWVGPITAADTSEGMLAEVRRKVAAAGACAITPVCLDLATAPAPTPRFDLVVAALVLHHVADTRSLLKAFRQVLRPGGWLALADLCREDGSFHPDVRVPHCGFDPAVLRTDLEEAGFGAVRWETVYAIHRHGRDYPVFLLTGRGTPSSL